MDIRIPELLMMLVACAAVACGDGRSPDDPGANAHKIQTPLNGIAGMVECTNQTVTNLASGREVVHVAPLAEGLNDVVIDAPPAGDVRLNAYTTAEYADGECVGPVTAIADPLEFRLEPGESKRVSQRFVFVGQELVIDAVFEELYLESGEDQLVFIAQTDLPGVARSIAADTHGVYLATQHGGTGRTTRLDPGSLQATWTTEVAGLDLASLASSNSRLFAVGSASPGVCGATDTVGSPEPKAAFANIDPTDGTVEACTASTRFPYSGYELGQAASARGEHVWTAALAETCGFGNHVSLVEKYDADGLLGRTSDPLVDFNQPACLGRSEPSSVANGASDSVYVAGLSALTSEGAARGFVAKYDGDLAAVWRMRTVRAARYTAVLEVDDTVLTVGTCDATACLEVFERDTGIAIASTDFDTGVSANRLVLLGGVAYAVGSLDERLYLARLDFGGITEVIHDANVGAGHAASAAGNSLYVAASGGADTTTVLRFDLALAGE